MWLEPILVMGRSFPFYFQQCAKIKIKIIENKIKLLQCKQGACNWLKYDYCNVNKMPIENMIKI